MNIGQSIVVFPENSTKQGGYPATVTHVHDDGSVNAYVCDDGNFPLGRPSSFKRVFSTEEASTGADSFSLDEPVDMKRDAPASKGANRGKSGK